MGNHRKPSDGDDVVEIISIGKLYTGPWHKKYWTSSRGKGRHPYPLGYCAVRVRSRHAYRMEIREGRNGPLFVVSCEDGVSGSGPTPSRAWEDHQRKSSSPVIKNGCARRLSGNIDGNELFGFKSLSVQRLFRELVLELNGMAEKSLVSSPVDDVVCQQENGNQTRGIYTSPCSFDVDDGLHAEVPNCPRSFVEVQGTRCKLLESMEHEHLLLLDACKLDTPSNPELHEQLPKKTNNEGRKMVSSCDALEMCSSDTLDCTQGSRKCLSVKQEGTMAVEPSETFSCHQDIVSTNICEALAQKSDLHNPKSFNVSSEEKLSPLVPAQDIAEGLEESQPQLCASSGSSAACSQTNPDCAEQEAAKSMMMFLLPRAIPLLKTYKRRRNHVKKTNCVPSFCRDGLNNEDKDADRVSNCVSMSARGGNVTENFPTKRFKQNNVGKMHDVKTVSTSVTLGGLYEYEKSAGHCMKNESDTEQQNMIYANSIIPDSFDDEHRSLLSPNKRINSSCNNVMMGLGSSQTHGLDVPILKSKICEDVTENNMDAPANKFFTKNVMDCTYSKVAKGNKSKVTLELKGCYIHPDPILSIFLIPKEDELQICVLSGCLKSIDRNVFIYKVDLQKQRAESPFFVGYTPLTFPVTEYPFRSIQLERSGLQFTPDGQFLIIHDSISVPFCRKQTVNCLCSVCEVLCFAGNGIRILHVEFGYVSVVTSLTTDKRVSSILACGSHLVAAEENGGLHAWKMESDWSAGLEFFLPGFYYVSHPILDLKKIPNSESLIIGHNGIGDFGLWDISKRSLMARFSSPGNLVFQVVPLSLFSWGENVGTDNLKMEEHVDDPDHVWTKDIAVSLLVSASSDFVDSYYHLVDEPLSNPFGRWRLALLAKETFIMGPLLDARSSAVESSFGRGILGTTDGLLCWWNLSTGENLGSINSCQGEGISCIAADEKSGALVVASDTCRLLVYAHQSCEMYRC